MLKGNKSLLALLLPVFVLAFCFAAFALDESDFIIVNGEHLTPEQWAEKQTVNMSAVDPDGVTPRMSMASNPEINDALKENPFQSALPDKNAPLVNLLFEGFEGGVVPPTGWTLTQFNTVETWEIDDYNPYAGTYNTSCYYDATYSSIQDEWLKSPAVNLATGGPWFLEFYWLMSYYWSVDPYDNYDAEVWISTDGGTTFTAKIWDESMAGVFSSWTWYGEQISLAAYSTQTNVVFGFRYSGYDGAQLSFDHISVNDAAPPVGRCCYGSAAAPSCADESQAACTARPDWLSWDEGLDCTNNPCPTGPPNDNCANAAPITLPTQVSGTTIAATLDCPGLLDWNAVWYIFDLTSTADCSNVTVDYSPTLQAIYTVGVIFMDDCACDDYVLYTTVEWVNSRPIIKWNMLPDGTYYFPAYVTLDAGGTPMDFIFDIYAVDCPPAPPNDDCVDAELMTFSAPWPDAQTVTAHNYGAQIDCPGLLDWNSVWYVFDVPSDWTWGYKVWADFCGTSPDLGTVGIILMDDCACDDYITHTSTNWTACGDGNPTTLWNCMPAGTYYYPVHMGAGVEQDFTLTITLDQCPEPTPGDDCTAPFEIVVTPQAYPPGFTYTDNNFTCGRGNAESSTCLSSYDGGEDIFYKLVITEPICLDITLDPLGTTYTGIALGDACPPAGSYYSDCLAEAHGYSSSPKGFRYTFTTPGVYFLMIDTWPSPNCIPAFDLYLAECPPPQPGDNCTDPLKVNLPADCPYNTTDSTCGRIDDYDQTCMSSYDGGEDILYEVNIDVAGYYEFIMDPMGTTWTGMGLGADCPPPGSTYSDCIAEVTDYSSSPHGFVVYLTPETYYLMIDTWPSPECIPMFGLTINCLEPPLMIWDKTIIEFCNAVTGGTGSDILTLTNDGDVDLTYNILIQYGLPPTKEIDGANIATAELYIPGTTVDVMFTITNASSDAEWIDEFTMTFPTGVFVNDADDLDCNSGDMIYDGTMGDGVTVTWVCDDPPMGCIYSTSYEDFNVNLTFDGGLGGPLNIDYTISGDDWGGLPHDISGSLQLGEDNPYTQWLSVAPDGGTIAGKGTQPITVSYDATLIDPGLYFASLVINHDGGMSPITIPVTLSVGDDHDPIAVIVIDRSGSMALTDAFDVTRIDRAKALAHVDADVLLNGGSSVAVMSFNGSDGIQLLQGFTTVVQEVHDAIDAVVNPRHDTPLAAAMCQAHCLLYAQGCGDDAIYTYTDGEENMSLLYDMCYICDRCYFHHATGWNYDCIPGTGNCTEWQECLADVFSNNAVTIVNYFGSPINPFTKSGPVPEDLYFLKYTAEASGGEFNYYADAAFVPGDANGDAAINVSDAVYIINYVFVAGPAPQPLESGDGNCDGTVNVSDAVYLINHVFTGGPAPDNCE
jgi:hypothetical protein